MYWRTNVNCFIQIRWIYSWWKYIRWNIMNMNNQQNGIHITNRIKICNISKSQLWNKRLNIRIWCGNATSYFVVSCLYSFATVCVRQYTVRPFWYNRRKLSHFMKQLTLTFKLTQPLTFIHSRAHSHYLPLTPCDIQCSRFHFLHQITHFVFI